MGSPDGKQAAEYEARTPEVVRAQAEARGCVVVYPSPRELFVDVDSPEQERYFDKCVEVLGRIEFPLTYKKRQSPSGQPGKLHITVTLPREVDERTRVLYQAVLGSDPLREVLSLERLGKGDEQPTCFFEKPVASGDAEIKWSK